MESDKPWLTDRYWIPHYNWEEEVRKHLNLPKKVVIHDVTIREAQQAPRVALKKDEQIRIYEALNEIGAPRAEVWVVTSEEDASAAKEMVRMGLDTKVIACTRWEKEDVDAAIDCDLDGIMLECVGNPWSVNAMWGMNEEEMIRKLTDVAIYAKEHGLFVKPIPWDSFRAPLNLLKRFAKTLVEEAHVDVFGISDTFGAALPWAVMYVVRELKKVIPNTPIEMHAHNDFGLALTDMIAAVCAGAEGVDTSINAMGERAGNAATEEVVIALEILLGVDTGIKLEKLWEVSQLMQELTKVKMAPNKPIVGEYLFTYESGMVVWMLEKVSEAGRPTAFMPFSPELIGYKPGIQYVIGKLSGATAVEIKLRELGIEASEEEINKITELVKKEGSIRKWEIPEYMFREIVRKVTGK